MNNSRQPGDKCNNYNILQILKSSVVYITSEYPNPHSKQEWLNVP